MDTKEKQQSIFTDSRLQKLTKAQLIDLIRVLENGKNRYRNLLEQQRVEFACLMKERCRQCLTQEKS